MLRIIALGGLGEIGLNMTVFESDDARLVVTVQYVVRRTQTRETARFERAGIA